MLFPRKNPLYREKPFKVVIKEIDKIDFITSIINLSEFEINYLMYKNPKISSIISAEPKLSEKLNILSKKFVEENGHPNHKYPVYLAIDYLRNCLSRASEIKIGTLILFHSENYIPIPLLIRHQIELWSSIEYLKKALDTFYYSDQSPEEETTFFDTLNRLYYGIRYQDYPKDQEKKEPDEKYESINCLTMLKKMNANICDLPVLSIYNTLSEFCHPNLPLNMKNIQYEASMQFGFKISDKVKQIHADTQYSFLMILKESSQGIYDSTEEILNRSIEEYFPE